MTKLTIPLTFHYKLLKLSLEELYRCTDTDELPVSLFPCISTKYVRDRVSSTLIILSFLKPTVEEIKDLNDK